MANNYNNEYYKVGFVTTHSGNIPNMLKYTGNLIVMSDLSSRDPRTKKNRLSLWLRGEEIATGFGFANKYMLDDATWWVGSYNEIMGPDGAGIFCPSYSYFYKDKDVDAITYFEKEGFTYKPISIENRINFTYSYTQEVYNELNTKITNGNTYQAGVNKEINDKITSLNTYVTNAYSYTLDYVKKSYDSALTYTDYRIKSLIGEAPETLDTLGEIAYWLRNAQTLGMSTVDEIMKIKGNMITHDEPVQNSDGTATYTYMSLKSTKQERTDEKIGEEVTYSYVPDGLDKDGNVKYKKVEAGTYAIYGFKEVEQGYNAITSYQVCGPFGNHQLSEILKRIVTPYHYEYPYVYIESVNGIEVSEWMKTAVPVGSTLSNLSCVCRVQDNDCTFSTLKLNGSITSINEKKEEYGAQIGGTFTSSVPSTVNILSTYIMNVTNVEVKEYPQLKGLVPAVLDTENVLKTGEQTLYFTDVLTKEFKYAFYLSGNVENITDAEKLSSSLASLYDGQEFLVDGTSETGTAISPLIEKGSVTHVFVCIPTDIASKDSFKASIVDENTKVEQQLWYLGKSRYSTDIVSVTLSDLANTHLGMKYSSLYLSTSRYPFANSFRFKIEW